MKLKRNRHALHAACTAVVDPGAVLDTDETVEQTRGRRVRRRVEVYAAPSPVADGWPTLGRVVRVVRSGERDGTAYHREGLYLTSRTDSAPRLAAVIRSHWHVENRLHWCKDVLQGEDLRGVRSKAGASVLSVLGGVALSVLRWNGQWSPTAARSRLSNRVPELLALLRT